MPVFFFPDILIDLHEGPLTQLKEHSAYKEAPPTCSESKVWIKVSVLQSLCSKHKRIPKGIISLRQTVGRKSKAFPRRS